MEDQDRSSRPIYRNPPSMSSVLNELWCKVVQPILEALEYSVRCCPLPTLFMLIFRTLSSRSLQILQIAAVYGGARLAHSHFFHSTQLGYMAQHTNQDHAFPISSFHHIQQPFARLTINSLQHPLIPDVPTSSLSASRTPQVFPQYPQPERRRMTSKR